MKGNPAWFVVPLLLGGLISVGSAAQYPPGPSYRSCPDSVTLFQVQQADTTLNPCYPAIGDTVKGIRGIITAFRLRSTGRIYMENSDAADYHALQVYTVGHTESQGFALGDEISVTGISQAYQGESQLQGTLGTSLTVRKISSGNPLPPARVGTTSSFKWTPATGAGSAFATLNPAEGMLVRVNGPLKVARTQAGAGLYAGTNWLLVNANGSAPGDSILIDGYTLTLTNISAPPLGYTVDWVQGIMRRAANAGVDCWLVSLRDVNDQSVQAPPNLSEAYPVAENKVRVIFDRNVDVATAQNPANYALGSALSGSTVDLATVVGGAGNVVDLTITDVQARLSLESIQTQNIGSASCPSCLSPQQSLDFVLGVLSCAEVQAPLADSLAGSPCLDKSQFAGGGSAWGARLTVRGVFVKQYGTLQFLEDAGGGQRSGVAAYNVPFGMTVGHQYLLACRVQEFYGMTELANPAALIDEGVVAVPAPQLQTVGVLNSSTCDPLQTITNAEDYEGVLVRVEYVTVVPFNTDPVLPVQGGSFRVVALPACADTLLVSSLGNTYPDFTPIVGQVLNVDGVLNIDTDVPRLLPRSSADIEVLSVPEPITSTWFGGGGNGEPCVQTGVWDFDDLSLAQRDAPGTCENTALRPFGDVLESFGWAPSAGSTVAGRVEYVGPGSWLMVPAEDVGGGGLSFYDSATSGFLPHQFTVMESPAFDPRQAEGPVTGWTVKFWTNCNRDFAPGELQLVVGSRWHGPQGWTAWADSLSTIQGGPKEHQQTVPIANDADNAQIRVGVKDPGDVPVPDKGPVVDEVKLEAKKPAGLSIWKTAPYIPDISQDSEAICQATAYANCLIYWSQKGYPALAPTVGTQKEKNTAVQNDLKDLVHGEKNLGSYGAVKYMKDKGVYKGTGKEGDPKLEMMISSDAAATWTYLKDQFQQCHDVLLRVKWYKPDGTLVDDVAHYVTVAGLEESADGKKSLYVANPWGESHDQPDEKTRDQAYDKLDVTTDANGRIRVDNDNLEQNAQGVKGADHLRVEDIEVIRPAAKKLLARMTAPAPAPAHADRAGTGLVAYVYALANEEASPMDYHAMILEVPYENVQSPAGWTWQPLPAYYPGRSDCNSIIGPSGILWTTTTNPVPPGTSLDGFGFSTSSDYPTETGGVGRFAATQGHTGGFVASWGPVLTLSPTVVEPGTQDAEFRRFYGMPNPARSSAHFRFALRQAGTVRLEIYDAAGRRVRRLLEGRLAAGQHDLAWDLRDDHGRSLPPGAYTCRLVAEDRRLSRRLVILR